MQVCYNCGKEVEDTVLICPECGALVKRYGKPNPQTAEPQSAPGFSPEPTAAPQGALWKTENGKLRFRGFVTFWLVLCAIFTGYTLLGFGCTLFIYRFQDLYFELLGEFEEFSAMAEMLSLLLESIALVPGYYIAVGLLIAVQFVCVIWFLASKRKLAFYIFAVAGALLSGLQLAFGGGISALIYILGPLVAWLLLRKSWKLLR